MRWVEQDVFVVFARSGESRARNSILIILDPPSFTKTKRQCARCPFAVIANCTCAPSIALARRNARDILLFPPHKQIQFYSMTRFGRRWSRRASSRPVGSIVFEQALDHPVCRPCRRRNISKGVLAGNEVDQFEQQNADERIGWKKNGTGGDEKSGNSKLTL